MSISFQQPTAPRHYVRVKCRCGQTLQAQPEMIGSAITCWSCHASVPVPVPVAPGNWVARLLRIGARQVLEGRTFTLLAIGAVVVTLSLRIPGHGVSGAALALALVMTGYGELLRRGSRGDWTDHAPVSFIARVWRFFICLAAGFALALPLFLALGSKTSPKVTPAGLAIAAGLVLVVPLVMLGTYVPRGSIRDRILMIGSMLRRHPVAVLTSLLILPFSLGMIEWILLTMTRAHGSFNFITLDLFPLPRFVKMIDGIPQFGQVDYRVLPDSTFLELYYDSLRQGHLLIGAIPASLALPVSNGLNTGHVFSTPDRYLTLRMFFTVFIVMCLLAVLAVQARWLGLISTMDLRRPTE